MSAIEKLEQRIAAVEAELARLKDAANKYHVERQRGWDAWFGAFANDPMFEKAMSYGRQWRESQKPKRQKKRKAKNGHS